MPVCIHKYLTSCKTNPQSPGFADFLRGTIALYNLSKVYHFKLGIDNSHALFQYLKSNENMISLNPSFPVIEVLPPLSYEDIYQNLENIFKNNKSFCTMTNSMYTFVNGKHENFGYISEDCQLFLRNMLCPSFELEKRINEIFENIYQFTINEEFIIIHLRNGDDLLHDKNNYNDQLYWNQYTRIKNIVDQNTTIKKVLLCDSATIGRKIKEEIPELYYWDNSKVHLGDLINNETNSVLDTLTDFFIMSKAKKIISCQHSGFSRVCSIIYDIPYIQL